MRLFLALKCFFAVLFLNRLPRGAEKLAGAPGEGAPALPPAAAAAPPPLSPAKDEGRSAVQLLALLQREGRLLDFLQEEIDGYTDAQVGAAVRDIHRGCRRVLAEHLPVEPVLKEAENARVRVDVGFDPSRIRLVGNVVGEPPFTGTLKHHGWRIGRVSLPTPGATAAGPSTPSNFDPSVVAPAEVELS
jgi:hypothetical protein